MPLTLRGLLNYARDRGCLVRPTGGAIIVSKNGREVGVRTTDDPQDVRDLMVETFDMAIPAEDGQR